MESIKLRYPACGYSREIRSRKAHKERIRATCPQCTATFQVTSAEVYRRRMAKLEEDFVLGREPDDGCLIF